MINKETIKNTVSLFLHCQKMISHPKRLTYNDLRSSISEIINEQEFNAMVSSIFNTADHYFLLETEQHPTKLLIEINAIADKLRLNMNPAQKLVFLTALFRMIKINHAEDNADLDKAFSCIAEIFSYNQEQTDSIKKMFNAEEPEIGDYQNSIVLTNEQPDYIKVINGLKVIYNPDFPFKIWVKNVKSVNNMLFKVIEYKEQECGSGIVSGDVLTYNSSLQGVLEDHGICLESLSSGIISNINTMPRIEIEATERSPKIVLNSLENRIEIEGVSMINHPANFFKPVFYWIEKLKETNPENISLHINLNFFNTYTSKIILKLMQAAIDMESLGCKPKFYWYHEEDDDEIKEAGEYYASIVNKEFTFISSSASDLISA